MKKSTILEVLLVTFLFLFSIYMWSLPIKNNPLPYGEVDAAHHYCIADYMTESDNIEELYKPSFLYYQYAYRSLLGPHYLSPKSPYTPNFFLNQAISQIIGGNRPLSYYLFLSILCVSIILSSYFLMRKLFGIIPAFLTSLLIMASKIDIMTFIMGQYVILVSFACLPLILYSYYKYTSSFLDKKPKQIYLYIMALLMVTQYFNHYQSLIDTFMILLIFSIFLVIKEKKIPFNFKHAVIATIIFLVLTGPFINRSWQSVKNAEVYYTEDTEDISDDWEDLFKWYTSGYDVIAVNQSVFSYKDMHGYWTLPLLILGSLFLSLRRKRKDLLLLSWIIALYLILHFDLFLGMGAGRLFRSVNNVPYIFYSLVAVGFMGLLSFIKVPPKTKRYITYVLIGIFILLFFNFNFKSSFEILDRGYAPPYSINNFQYDAARWMNDNLKEDDIIYNKGTLIQKTRRFIRCVSHRFMIANEEQKEWLIDTYKDDNFDTQYYFIDYSELSGLGMNKEVEELQHWEKENLINSTLVYNNQFVRIYDVR